MNSRAALAPLLLLGIASCLIPSYKTDQEATGGSVGSVGSIAEAGKMPSAGSASGGSSSPVGGDGACSAEQKSCAGECVDIADVIYGCGATSCNQSECPAGGREYACLAGKCVIATCAAGKKACDGRCVAIDDPTYGCSADGCDASACPNPGTDTLTCSGSLCVVGECDASKKKCASNCVPPDANYGCADPGSCSSCAANEVCNGTPSKCACLPDDVEACRGKACGPSINNCGQSVTCPDTCVAPESCGGGTATANECGCSPNNACSGKQCGSVNDVCGATVNCMNTCGGPTPACASNTCVECTAAADCPAVVCAKATCTNNKCSYGTVATNSNCVGGTCSTTNVGICNRPQVTVGTFKIDATEVTRGAYLAFVQAKNGNTAGQPAACSTNTSYVPPTGWPPALADYQMPAVYVDWCDAYAYCSWAGGRLCGKIGGGTLTNGEPYDDPAQSQWMRACSGAAGTAFPYGSAYVDNRCNGAQPVAVGSFPQCVGAYPGLYDLSGNSPEWEDACINGDNLCRKRGAHYGDSPENNYILLRCDDNGYQPRDTKDANISFRCCSSP